MKTLLAFFIRVLSGTQPRWKGCQPLERPCVYFANHTSHLDAMVIWSGLPSSIRARTRPVAARDYWTASRIRLWMAEKVFNALLIERINVTAHDNPLDGALEALDAGDSLILFPEGTRSSSIEPKAFKSGLYHLAKKRPEIDFIPVYLENLNRILPKGEFLPVPLIGSITFGAPVRYESGETKQLFLERARTAVWSLHST